MNADWLFDGEPVAGVLTRFAREAAGALGSARALLEQGDGEEPPTDHELRRLAAVREAIADARRHLAEIDHDLLAAADPLMRDARTAKRREIPPRGMGAALSSGINPTCTPPLRQLT